MLRQIGALGMTLALANVRRRVRALAVRGVLGVLGVAVLLIALCFLLVAVYLWLALLVGPVVSAAILGGALLAVAIILLLLASRPMRGQAKAEEAVEDAVDSLRESASKLADALGAERQALRSPVMVGAGLALIVGFLLGRQGRRRGGGE